ncbi:phage shock protein C (PspC) family protein [Cricetibacter osteomyelitidis]|uniref:Phage shock protein C (PspC) family protein n=1 Tax=Cricetibacter osteomyelitidis TaxID=1521931 RepID=A0A4R2SSL1_9PAST|nr:PspC domain-containing protein [Cricetibacter osteomyelitidis]TCP92165.1 phage shock protein C (PspC) family protein [Cricetibacter osteomyelitidis]
MIYRYPKEGQVAGVCIGLAKHFGLDTWIIRQAFVLLFFLGGTLFLPLAYFAAVLLMEKAPESYYRTPITQFHFNGSVNPPSRTAQKIHQIRLELEYTKLRVADVERYTHSDQFHKGTK